MLVKLPIFKATNDPEAYLAWEMKLQRRSSQGAGGGHAPPPHTKLFHFFFNFFKLYVFNFF